MLPDLAVKTAQVRQMIDAAQQITVLTGAGISTDSGIPDFRGPNGVWTKNPGAEKSANIANFVRDPEVRKNSWRRYLDGGVWVDREPNAGHRALVDLEARGKLHTLITQNVDGLHLKAGTSKAKLVEIHGTMAEAACLSCARRWPIEAILKRVRAGDADPHCENCNGLVKSATISFGQALVVADLERSDRAANACDLMLAVGTSLTVTPIANVVPIAYRHGAKVVIVNAEPTPVDGIAHAVLRAGISELLPQLVRSEGLLPRANRS